MVLAPAVVAFLNEKRYAVLATNNGDGAPRQTVMWFELDGDEILMNTRRGRAKDRNLLADPRASICIEDGYRYVAIAGRITMNDDQTVAHADIKRLATRYEGTETAEQQMADAFGKQTRVTLRLSIDHVVADGF